MDPNLDARLRAMEQKIDENNRILTRMRNVQRNANLIRAGYWVIVILLFFVSIYFIKPYLGQLGSVYGLGGNSSSTSGSSSTGAEDLLKQLQEFQKNNQ